MEMLVKLANDYTKDLYPLTIVNDRYNGTYSGGKYTAWHLDFYEIPNDIAMDDITVNEFWGVEDLCYLVGKGDTIEQAYKDLKSKVEDFIVWLEIKGYSLSRYGISENTPEYRNAICKFNMGK